MFSDWYRNGVEDAHKVAERFPANYSASDVDGLAHDLWDVLFDEGNVHLAADDTLEADEYWTGFWNTLETLV